MMDATRAQLRASFSNSLPIPDSIEPHLRESLRLILSHPGSLARPQIIVEMAAAYGQQQQQGEALATALEYFHTASLVFDDLPCMDNAAERRGAACLHLQYGDAGAILAALALVNRAYALLWRAVAGCPRELQARSLDYVEQRLGVEGLLNGQSMDLRYASLPHTQATTETIALGKTVSLIRLTLVLPALLGGAPEVELRLLERLAIFWGLSYQTLDDLKDIIQTSADTGKTAARDAVLDRPNAALVLGPVAALDRVERLVRLSERTLHKLLKNNANLSFLSRLSTDMQTEFSRLSDHLQAVPAGRSR